MTDFSFHFSDPNLDDKEKIRELTTFVKGCALLLQDQAQKLDTYFQFIEDELYDNARGQDFLKQAMALTHSLGSLSALLAPQEVIGKEGESLSVRPLINGVLNRCKTIFSDQPCSFELDCPEDLTVFGDTMQLQQMVFSMLKSLHDVLPRGTAVITIQAQLKNLSDSDLRRMGISCGGGNYIEIILRDGDAPKYTGTFSTLPTILTPEPQIPFEKNAMISWLGILSRHEGALLLDCRAEQPAIKLLIAQSTPRTVRQQDNELPVPKGNETILLVDDEDMIWDLVIDTLSNLGYTVLLAGDGQEAIDTYRANPGAVDLVIMDMVMPGINGREAFEQLKKLDPQVKVLLSSGYVSDEDANFVLKAGALGFLRKPYSMKKLGRTVRAILDGRPLNPQEH